MALMWPLYGYPSKSLYQNAAASIEVALPYDRTVYGAPPCRTRTGLQASTLVSDRAAHFDRDSEYYLS